MPIQPDASEPMCRLRHVWVSMKTSVMLVGSISVILPDLVHCLRSSAGG